MWFPRCDLNGHTITYYFQAALFNLRALFLQQGFMLQKPKQYGPPCACIEETPYKHQLIGWPFSLLCFLPWWQSKHHQHFCQYQYDWLHIGVTRKINRIRIQLPSSKEGRIESPLWHLFLHIHNDADEYYQGSSSRPKSHRAQAQEMTWKKLGHLVLKQGWMDGKKLFSFLLCFQKDLSRSSCWNLESGWALIHWRKYSRIQPVSAQYC